MAKCPKCSLELSPTTKKCPNCQTPISSVKTGFTMELPKLKTEITPKIETPVKEIEVLSLEETQPLTKTPRKEIKVKQIPVIFKDAATTKQPKEKKERQKNNIVDILTNIKIESTLKIAAVAILLILNITLIINIVVEVDHTNPSVVASLENSIKKELNLNMELNGLWTTQNNGLFNFQADGKFYWYDNSLVLNDNYFGGTYTYKQGLEALDEMGYTEDNFRLEFNDILDLKNVYSLELKPLFAYKNKKDTTVNDLKDNEKWWFLLIIKDNETAYAYNKTLDLYYTLTKS